jgi:hypothetical protein
MNNLLINLKQLTNTFNKISSRHSLPKSLSNEVRYFVF